MLWLLLGVSAIITAILNRTFTGTAKSNPWLGFSSLSLTALTVCAFYSDAAVRVIQEDWSALMDILPTTSRALWVCVIFSIIINGLSLRTKQSQ